MKFKIQSAGILLGLLILGGCATSRSVVDIPLQTTGKAVEVNGKEVYLNSISDRRVFEKNPSSPNIPSLDPSEDQNDRIKARAIGRKRNSYGKALGDILLKDGESVESVTTASLRQAFIEKGYRVVDRKDQISSNTYIVDTEIVKFWSWMNPGFWAITLSAEISTGLTIKSPNGIDKQTISVTAADNFQTAVEGNWMEVMSKALRAYIDDVNVKLK